MIGWSEEVIRERNRQYRGQEMTSNPSTLYRLEALDDSGWGFKMQGRDYNELTKVGEKWVASKFCTEFNISEISS